MMAVPKTLLELAGADLSPAGIEDACLVLIDLQNEYLAGPLAVVGVEHAVARAADLLQAARGQRSPVVHVVHAGRPGGPFDRADVRGQIVAPLDPLPGEAVVEKRLPNAFAETELASLIAATGRKELIVCGFMTHMCVSSTVRAALDHGYRTTVSAAACGTRDLPDGLGGTLSAGTVHAVALAELADRFAIIAPEAIEAG